MSISSSNVPDAQYEVDAINCLQEAYTLYPSNLAKRVMRFSQIFAEKYPSSVGWKVGQACKQIYSEKERGNFIDINVGTVPNTFIVKIFE